MAKPPSEDLCTWSTENRSMAPKWGQGPRLKNPNLEQNKLSFTVQSL